MIPVATSLRYSHHVLLKPNQLNFSVSLSPVRLRCCFVSCKICSRPSEIWHHNSPIKLTDVRYQSTRRSYTTAVEASHW